VFPVVYKQYWSSSPQNNVNFLQGMVDEGNARGVVMGTSRLSHLPSADAYFPDIFSLFPLSVISTLP
jgi:hypothetical protein